MNIQEIFSRKNLVKVIYVDDKLNKSSFYDAVDSGFLLTSMF